MPDSTLTQALKEAYASAPAGTIIHHTLEFRHSAFTQPLRVVRGFADLVATLEDSAPADPGVAVTFAAYAFDLTRPEVNPQGVPQIQIEIDNVSREIIANIEAAIQTTERVKVTYREFLSTDLAGPQNDPPIHMTVLQIKAGIFRIVATAGFPDLANKRFPTQEYSADVFPGLLTS